MDFSLYFLQLSVGCIALLPVVPWRSVGKGYYVMMLSIGLGLAFVAGLFRLETPLVIYGTLVAVALGSWWSAKGEWAWAITLFAAFKGVTTVLMDAARSVEFAHSPAASIPLLGFNFLAGTLLLGSVLSAMLLGHWYLVVRDLPVEPLRRMTLLFFGALGARLAATVAAFLLDPVGGKAVADRSFLFVLVYGLFSLGSPIGMSWMIWGTVRIRSTQAATGILYGVTAFILMGEAAGRFVLIKTGFPL